jgi:hypothetical protein
VAGFSMLLAIPLLFWCLFRLQAFGLPIFVGTLTTYGFAWTGGLITEFRPDLISGLLLGAGVLVLCQRAFNERVPLIVAPIFIFASLYAKPTTFLPLFITAGATILLVYLCYARWGLGMAPLRKSGVTLAISLSVALLLPFLFINLAPISAYVYRAFVSDSHIWGGPFESQSLIERMTWYLQPSGGGAITLPLNNMILIVAIVVLLVVRLILCRRLGSERSKGYYKGFTLALLCGVPYFLMASVSNNKSYFLGIFIGIFMSLLLAGILATLVLEWGLSRRRLLNFLAFLVVAFMGILAMAAPPPEAFLWSRGNSLQARMLHRDTVDQALALLSQSPALLRAKGRVFVAATESLHGDLVEAYLQIHLPQANSFQVTDGESVSGEQKLMREIDNSDIIVFESSDIATPSYAFDLYMPSVQSYLQEMAKGGKDLQVLETKARVRTKDGRSQGVLIMSRLR